VAEHHACTAAFAQNEKVTVRACKKCLEAVLLLPHAARQVLACCSSVLPHDAKQRLQLLLLLPLLLLSTTPDGLFHSLGFSAHASKSQQGPSIPGSHKALTLCVTLPTSASSTLSLAPSFCSRATAAARPSSAAKVASLRMAGVHSKLHYCILSTCRVASWQATLISFGLYR
jgi:hypothetical protein